MTKVWLTTCLILVLGCAKSPEETPAASSIYLTGLWAATGVECFSSSAKVATAPSELSEDTISFHGNSFTWNLVEAQKCSVTLSGSLAFNSSSDVTIVRKTTAVGYGTSCNSGAGDTCTATACNVDDSITSAQISPTVVTQVFTKNVTVSGSNTFSYDPSGVLWLKSSQTSGAGTTCYKRYDIYSWYN